MAVPRITLRQPLPGDFGWVVQSHGELYAREYGWNSQFEALVARVVADYVDNFDPERERAWIATLSGERVGSVFLVKQSDSVAKLRLLLVDPAARSHGLGRRLVHECTTFARAAGYARIVLWTQSVLTTARHIYEAAGYRLVKSEPNRSFGADLVSETWELEL